ncbi:GNAT family N-acetyltransferase [Oceanobacillus chungangensis]|uniref:GNAT family N-acetyltransferase n=2 Tax=Oceanobacillus chungangensis TaxID=1229152 RepID=A0A3D8PW14_9BACI|nr:GNAT family N-acetyltransferase [Oceanobacillus chungangensis]
MKKKDIPQVQHVARTSWNATYEGIIPRDIQENFLNAAYSDKNMKSRLKHSIVFVAEVDGRIVGFANYSPITSEGTTELGAIYLHPEFQGRGIGTGFLQHGINHFSNVEEIHLNVEKNNEIGMNFYNAKGFEVVSEFEDNFGGHILHTVRMVLKVNKIMSKS